MPNNLLKLPILLTNKIQWMSNSITVNWWLLFTWIHCLLLMWYLQVVVQLPPFIPILFKPTRKNHPAPWRLCFNPFLIWGFSDFSFLLMLRRILTRSEPSCWPWHHKRSVWSLDKTAKSYATLYVDIHFRC